MWDRAQALRRSSHFREAVTAAARKVNAETQNKVARRDVRETKLFQQVFSVDAPTMVSPDCDSRPMTAAIPSAVSTAAPWPSLKDASRASATPNSPKDGLPELPEHEALEQIAALSVLARSVDAAALTT